MNANELWYTTVAFGGNPTPTGPWRTADDAVATLNRWFRRTGADAGTLIAAHTVRVQGHHTREQARNADISEHAPYTRGIYDFIAENS